MLRTRLFLCVTAAAGANISNPSFSKPASSSFARVGDEVKTRIEQRIDAINEETLRPLDVFGYVPKSTYSMPMVMLLGNHSAGKSTFINRLLGVEEQETGVAPTDDGFTVIMRGDVNVDADGPSAISSPQHQFQDLGQYGPNFVNHFRLKCRSLPESSPFPSGMMIVDTPGMIDTPVHVEDRTTLEGQNRGYDFLAVTRWFAQRADVILLMFDPANPGTTGETLDVLTRSLTGFEHKFLILMNKVDMFDKVTDFARAYGTICWNLSKVIKMKDIPRIYTTFTPLLGVNIDESGQPILKKNGSGVPLNEMDRARRDVLEEVLKAPLRRLDNLITEMEEASKRVLLSGKACTFLQRRVRSRRALVYGGISCACFLCPVGIGSALLTLDIATMFLTTIISGGIAGAAALVGKRHLQEYERHLVDTIDNVLEELYPGKLKTAELRQRWERSIRPTLLESIASNRSLATLPAMSGRKMNRLEAVASQDVPTLRSEVAEYKEKIVREATAAAKS